MTLVKMLPILCNAVIKANRTLKYKTYLNKKKSFLVLVKDSTCNLRSLFCKLQKDLKLIETK